MGGGGAHNFHGPTGGKYKNTGLLGWSVEHSNKSGPHLKKVCETLK
jgi:hypothetical protein